MDLNHLNPAQKEAVLHSDGPVMILAGAGSGKTRTLVSRIQHLLDDKKISPFHILAVTFSNKAAREMRERVSSASKYDLGALQITTFHAFCARLLRSEAQYLGLSRNFTIYDQVESKSIIKNILGKRGISLKEQSPIEVQYYIDELKNLGHYVNAKKNDELEEIDKEDPFYSYFVEYESELHKSNAVDFGGLITGVLNLFDNFPDVLERYQKRFKYVLVDEYQDTNRAQFKLIKLLAQFNRNICVVGDEDQSIYSWRGADIRNILDFEDVFSDAHIIKLEQNYRSSKNIIEAASHVISKNVQRKGKELWTDNERGESIKILECSDDKSEAEFVGNEVKRLIQVENIDPNDIAVFYRTNAQSRMIEDSLRQGRISYRVVAGIKFYERKEIKDLLAYIRLIVNDKDSLALSRIINVPVRGIGATTLRKIEQEAIKIQSSLWETIEKIVDNYEDYKHLRLSSKVRTSLNQFVDLIQEVKILEKNKELPSISYEKLLSESGYMESLLAEKSYESQARIENLEELLSAIKQFEESAEVPSLLSFLETITLDTEVDDDEVVSEVSLMTIHGSKGLEYPYVFVVGAEESVFPSYRSIEEGDTAIEEERRLFYVAMTRAMKRLYLLFAQGRMLWGSLKFNGPSRFLDEIPEDYYTWKFYKKGQESSRVLTKNKIVDGVDYGDEFSQVNPSYDFENNSYIQSEISTKISTYPKGTKVKHKLYGDGIVTSTEGSGADEKIVIKFKDGASKKFMVKFAPIEKI